MLETFEQGRLSQLLTILESGNLSKMFGISVPRHHSQMCVGSESRHISPLLVNFESGHLNLNIPSQSRLQIIETVGSLVSSDDIYDAEVWPEPTNVLPGLTRSILGRDLDVDAECWN